MDLPLLLVHLGEGVVEFHLETAIRRFQFCDALLRVGLLQFNDAPTQGAHVQTGVFGDLRQRLLSHHANR